MNTKEMYARCCLCLRRCGVNRYKNYGVCKSGTVVYAARAGLHFGEEPVLVGQGGSGTVFFSGCCLGCTFCQNAEISLRGRGFPLSAAQLCQIFLNLEAQGAENINLVTPTHYVPSIIEALRAAREKGLSLPAVYNTGTADTPETIRALHGYIDIYLPDVKFFSPTLATKFTGAPRYFENCLNSLREMAAQQPRNIVQKGILKKGIILRHLMLPGCLFDTKKILDALVPFNRYPLSLMCQYTPGLGTGGPDKCLSPTHYRSMVEHALSLGFTLFTQESSSVGAGYVPLFDGSGLPI